MNGLLCVVMGWVVEKWSSSRTLQIGLEKWFPGSLVWFERASELRSRDL